MLQGAILFRGLFERAPLPLLVLTPDLRIVNANDAYLSAVGRRRDALAGLDMFDAFPDSPHNPNATGVRNLSASLERALRSGGRDLMPTQRYDVQPEQRSWEVRYWIPANWTVLDETDSVLALVHHVVDVTSDVLKARAAPGRGRPIELLPGPRIVTVVAAELNARQIEDARQTIQQARAVLAQSEAALRPRSPLGGIERPQAPFPAVWPASGSAPPSEPSRSEAHLHAGPGDGKSPYRRKL